MSREHSVVIQLDAPFNTETVSSILENALKSDVKLFLNYDAHEPCSVEVALKKIVDITELRRSAGDRHSYIRLMTADGAELSLLFNQDVTYGEIIATSFSPHWDREIMDGVFLFDLGRVLKFLVPLFDDYCILNLVIEAS